MNSKIISFLLCSLFLTVPAYVARAADATSFNPLPIRLDAQGTIAVGTIIPWPSSYNPSDWEKWLECNGQPVNAAAYPDLAPLVGANTPNLQNQFMRGGTTAQVRQTAADTTRSHYHGQPTHTHSVDARLTSTAVSGTAAGQRYLDSGIRWEQRWNTVTAGPDPAMYSWLQSDNQQRTAASSSVSAYVNNGASTGIAHASGADNTYQNSNSDGTQGGAETAPQHMRVRYLIRALK